MSQSTKKSLASIQANRNFPVDPEGTDLEQRSAVSKMQERIVSDSSNLDEFKYPSWFAFQRFSLAGLVSLALLFTYGIAFIKSMNGRWFNPGWTTDDATQQTYPFYEAIYPGLFSNDLVTEVMRGCLPPLHYWIGHGITLLTADPVMTGHWIMLIQVCFAIGFFFLAVRALSSNVPAILAVLWLLHSRNTMQRMTGGLPRGWTPAIFAAFLYFASTRNHWGALVAILAGSMLNPPGALIVGVAYGFLILWRWVSSTGEARIIARRRIFQCLLVAPLFVLVALFVVQRPAHIGQMVSFTEATKMPEFQRPHGRFPFLPLRPAFDEYQMFGLQAFIGRFYRPAEFWRQNIWWMVGVSLAGLALLGARRRKIALPAELMLFGLASLCTYTLSRIFAFRLFVPDRHLQIPMVFFITGTFAVGIWRAFVRSNQVCVAKRQQPASTFSAAWPALLAFALVGVVVWECSKAGLQGDANFNYPISKRGRMYEWIKNNTPQDAFLASHPTHCDGMQLFGVRRALVTTETSHPFYPRYNLEMRRRSEVSLRAHYAERLEDVYTLLQPEGITHFVFRRDDFKPNVLPKMKYFPPLDTMVKDLVTRPSGRYAYNDLPPKVDLVNFPFVKFIDDVSTVIDVQELGTYLRAHGWVPSQASMTASLGRHSASRLTLVASGAIDPNGLQS